MNVKIVERYPVFCDTGQNDGMYRIDFRGSAYLTSEEMEKYDMSGSLTVSITEPKPSEAS